MNDAIIILGMHRSGTSCLAGCLKSLGLNLGVVSDYNTYNKKGNQENKKVFKLNESILNHNQGSWDAPPEKHLVLDEQSKQAIKDIISQYHQSDKPWGIKDPRMLMAYDLWAPYLPPHSLVGTFRHPLAVSESLFARDAFPIPKQQGLKMWQTYNTQLIKLHEKNNFELINFDLPQDEYITQIHNMAAGLGLSQQADETFFESTLRNQSSYAFEDCPDDLKPTYQKLLEIC